jgi:hypothetical protein
MVNDGYIKKVLRRLMKVNDDYIIWLVVWNILFPDIGNVIIPTDELIFFRGVGQPPTRYR